MLPKQIDLQQIKKFVDQCGPGTKIYIGCDSERVLHRNKWHADYVVAVVVHINGNRGCRIFGCINREIDYDQRMDKPQMRLMNEVYKVAALYLDLAPLLEDHNIEVHLDINPDTKHGSSCVVQQAIGYVRGVCNVIPMIKPRAFAASTAADRLKGIHAKIA